ncbi:tetratricopeptide repeat-containing sensor histidine kinase [Taibaiella koreensis]|uniref:tetratricopeptide repeat-containing sensor histidine kinase n=1 Tax=Taibaiella koreensis TaxID=1268548 RepID=UPI000E59AA56|nr:ATP-binding protein [Taibaiella koreensis]
MLVLNLQKAVRYIRISNLLLLLILLFSMPARGQQQYVKDLEQNVYHLNNEFKYDESITTIRNFLATAKSNDDRYYGFLFLSFTYRRLFDDLVALRYLDTALAYGLNTARRDYYQHNIACQKSMILFNLQHYEAADSIMKVVANSNYKDLSVSDQAKIFVQEGYISFRNKNYSAAEEKYQKAIKQIKTASPCDLPLIYGRQIQLYAAMRQPGRMDTSFRLAIKAADDCEIAKSKLFAHEMMVQAYYAMGDYKNAYLYLRKLEALTRQYDTRAHLEKMTALDKKYQTKEKETKLLLQEKQIQEKNFFIVLLTGSFIVIIILGLTGFLVRRQHRLKREKLLHTQFTGQLLKNIEQERGRIAGELHDGITHDLLTLKNTLQNGIDPSEEKIDRIINDIRQISRNLHPVMLDKIGLKPSIENLCERYMRDERLFVMTEIDYEKQLSPGGELQLYRIVQEALTNIEKYACAHAAKIAVAPQDHILLVSIKDNGKGFDVSETLSNGHAFGLYSIIERSKALGGEARITSGDSGTTIHIEIPIQHG